MAPATVAEALAAARAAGLDRLDAQLLLGHHLKQPRSWLLAHDDAALASEVAAAFAQDCAERARGVPLAQLLGEKEFHGLMLRVTPSVLVPRPDTETLVDWALQLGDEHTAAAAEPQPLQVVDLGTGSGAIALALAHARPHWCVTATDASPAALAVARGNAERLGLRVRFRRGDWYAALGPQPHAEHTATAPLQADLLLSNPPYIALGDPHLPALHAEPLMALVSGADGLDALRALIDGAPAHLQPGGWLLLEHGHDQADAVAALLRARGFEAIAHRHDLAGIRRCTGGRWPGRA